MKRGKYEAPHAPKHHNAKKGLAMLLSLVLVIGCVVGGTLAWLTDTTDPVTNTFTIGDIDLTLKESPYTNGKYESPAENVNNSYPLIPGNTYEKDPFVTITKNSEACYLFVKVAKVNNPDIYLDYALTLTADKGWQPVEGETDVYYREVAKSDTDQSWNLLDNDTISVKDTIVKAGTITEGTNNVAMPAASSEPKLTFTAYAVQQANLTVEQAWDLVNN